ncbi:MAG: hypothetical protein M3O36_01235, partial [Myxococcota bacterium]|nr:hypothetical protein [Myxococcota bacterium]
DAPLLPLAAAPLVDAPLLPLAAAPLVDAPLVATPLPVPDAPLPPLVPPSLLLPLLEPLPAEGEGELSEPHPRRKTPGRMAIHIDLIICCSVFEGKRVARPKRWPRRSVVGREG